MASLASYSVLKLWVASMTGTWVPVVTSCWIYKILVRENSRIQLMEKWEQDWNHASAEKWQNWKR